MPLKYFIKLFKDMIAFYFDHIHPYSVILFDGT